MFKGLIHQGVFSWNAESRPHTYIKPATLWPKYEAKLNFLHTIQLRAFYWFPRRRKCNQVLEDALETIKSVHMIIYLRSPRIYTYRFVFRPEQMDFLFLISVAAEVLLIVFNVASALRSGYAATGCKESMKLNAAINLDYWPSINRSECLPASGIIRERAKHMLWARGNWNVYIFKD